MAELPFTIPDDRTFIPPHDGMTLFIAVQLDFYKELQGERTILYEWQMGKKYKLYIFTFGKRETPYCWMYVDRTYENYGETHGRCDKDKDGVYETDITSVDDINKITGMGEAWLN